jgi:hypothetical protein
MRRFCYWYINVNSRIFREQNFSTNVEYVGEIIRVLDAIIFPFLGWSTIFVAYAMGQTNV